MSPASIKKGSSLGTEVVHQEVQGSGGTTEPNHGDAADGHGAGGGVSTSTIETTVLIKRKRGRPRRFDHHHPHNVNTVLNVSPAPGFSSSVLSRSSEKRGRGRPRGSGRLQLLASLGGFAAETAGGIFIPYVISVNKGEDIVSKISSFAKRGPRAVCILSATGIVSNVIIRQPGSSGGLLRFEGRFEILSLSGSFTFSETSSSRQKLGMLSVSLAKPDGRVFGGGVVGSLIASGPIQLIVASFKQNISKDIKQRLPAESPACSAPGNSETVKFPIQIAGIADDGDQERCTTPTSAVLEPRNGEVAANTTTVNQQMTPVSQNGGAQNVFQSPLHISDQKLSPDINVCVPQI